MSSLADQVKGLYKEQKRQQIVDEQLYLKTSLVFSYQGVSNFIFIASKGVGKSVVSVETLIQLKRKYGYNNVKGYYFRLTDLACKQMLANSAQKAVDPYLVDKYDLDITCKGYHVYDHGKQLFEMLPLTSAGSKGKGSAYYDANFLNKRPIDKKTGKPIKRFIVTIWDEFLMAEGIEKKSVGSPVKQYKLYMDAIMRDQERVDYNAVYNFFLANSVSECANVTGALFNYIPMPDNHRITKLTRRHAVFWNVPVTKKYLETRKRSYNADIMDYEHDPNYTNVVKRDLELVKPKRTQLRRLCQVIKFDKQDQQYWFCVYDDKYIRQYKNEKFSRQMVTAMTRHLDEVYDADKVLSVLERYDTRSFYYADVMSQALFQSCMKEIKAR